jgi:hypothetical protein
MLEAVHVTKREEVCLYTSIYTKYGNTTKLKKRISVGYIERTSAGNTE